MSSRIDIWVLFHDNCPHFHKSFFNSLNQLQVNASTRAKQTAHTLQEKLSETKDKLRHSENAIIELRKRQVSFNIVSEVSRQF